MLARPNRLTRGSDYRHVVRRGRRCAARHTVTHVASREGSDVRFGFIVAKNVGGAVMRNTIRRRLKAISFEMLPRIPAGTDVVVRALPSAPEASFDDLRAEVDRCLGRVIA